MIQKKLDVKMVTSDPPATVNLCESVKEVQEMVINYTYKDLGRQMMILDLGAPVGIAGASWMKQYLAEFGLEIEDMKSVGCNQPFTFGPSKRYISKSLVELPVVLTRMDGKEDVLKVLTYLVDADVPFLCGKRTMIAKMEFKDRYKEYGVGNRDRWNKEGFQADRDGRKSCGDRDREEKCKGRGDIFCKGRREIGYV